MRTNLGVARSAVKRQRMSAESFEDNVVVVEDAEDVGVVVAEEAMARTDPQEILKRLDTATPSKLVSATEETLANLPMLCSQLKSKEALILMF